MKKLLLAFLIVFSVTTYANTEFNLTRAILTHEVLDREPGITKEVFPLYSKAYFYTEFKDIGESKTIYHNWYYTDEEGEKNLTASVPLKIAGSRWRTWSIKNLYLPGNWSIEVVDGAGNILSASDFTVE